MPLYEYECGACRNKFERRQGYNDEPISVCPSCGGKCRRLIHATAFIVKGGDYKESRTSDNPDVMGKYYGSGDEFFDRSRRTPEETIETQKCDAITRGMIKEAGVG